jgi:hypothetical protein
MKSHQKISFRIIFSLTVLFCFGLNPYSSYDKQRCIVEFSSVANSDGNSFIPDIDSFNDDQITQTDKISSLAEPKNQLPAPRDSFLIFKFCISVWQPPKLS